MKYREHGLLNIRTKSFNITCSFEEFFFAFQNNYINNCHLFLKDNNKIKHMHFSTKSIGVAKQYRLFRFMTKSNRIFYVLQFSFPVFTFYSSCLPVYNSIFIVHHHQLSISIHCIVFTVNDLEHSRLWTSALTILF